jgi:hypothetical protein
MLRFSLLMPDAALVGWSGGGICGLKNWAACYGSKRPLLILVLLASSCRSLRLYHRYRPDCFVSSRTDTNETFQDRRGGGVHDHAQNLDEHQSSFSVEGDCMRQVDCMRHQADACL